MSKFIIIDKETGNKVLNTIFFTRKLAEFYMHKLSIKNRKLEVKEV